MREIGVLRPVERPIGMTNCFGSASSKPFVAYGRKSAFQLDMFGVDRRNNCSRRAATAVARMNRYRRFSLIERAHRQFGEIYIDLVVPAQGLDIDELEVWCIRMFGEKWRSWTHAPHWRLHWGERRDYVRFFFADPAMAERFRSYWLAQSG